MISFMKASYMSKLPSHDLLKDFCGLKYSLFQIIIVFHAPLLYTIIVLAVLGDKKRKNKKEGIINEL